MKAWIVILVLVAALYWEHRQRLNRSAQARGVGNRFSSRPLATGIVRSTGNRIRQATQFSTTGSGSPGSGVQTQQPAMQSTWAIGGIFGPGNVGPSYLPEHSSKRMTA
jgi:hypothetical protein